MYADYECSVTSLSAKTTHIMIALISKINKLGTEVSDDNLRN